jgi:hypothetical protein
MKVEFLEEGGVHVEDCVADARWPELHRFAVDSGLDGLRLVLELSPSYHDRLLPTPQRSTHTRE